MWEVTDNHEEGNKKKQKGEIRGSGQGKREGNITRGASWYAGGDGRWPVRSAERKG